MFPDAVTLGHADYAHTKENITETDPEELCLRTISSYISELVAVSWRCAADSGEIWNEESKPNTYQFYQEPN